MKIIGINGLKTAGKDTTYECVHDLLSYKQIVKRAAFADKLKIMAMLALGYEGEPGELIALANKLKEDGGTVNSTFIQASAKTGFPMPHGKMITGREYLQQFGGRAREVFGESFWVDQVLPRPERGADPFQALKSIIDPWTGTPRGDFDVLCVTDVRYPNEAARILEYDGFAGIEAKVWEVRRPGLKSDGHASEAPLPRDLVSAVIPNDGTINDLREQVEGALLL